MALSNVKSSLNIFSLLHRDIFYNEKLTFFFLIILAPIQELPPLSYGGTLAIKYFVDLFFILQQFVVGDHQLVFRIRSDVYNLFPFLFIILVSTLFSYSLQTSIISFFRLVVIFLLIYSFRFYFSDSSNTIYFKNILVVMGIIIGFSSIIEYATIHGRTHSIFGNPNSLGQLCAMMGIIFTGELLFGKGTKSKRNITAISLSLIFLALLTTFSRSSVLMFIIGSFLLLGIRYGRKAILLYIFIAILGLTSYIFFATEVNMLLRLERKLSFRDTIWKMCFDIFQDNWLVGIGPGCLNTQIGAYLLSPPSAARTTIWAVNFSAHNDYLQVLSESGILGFITYIALLGSVLRIFFKRLKVMKQTEDRGMIYTFLALFAGCFCASFFEVLFLFGSFSVAIFFWMYAESALAETAHHARI